MAGCIFKKAYDSWCSVLLCAARVLKAGHKTPLKSFQEKFRLYYFHAPEENILNSHSL